MDDTIEDLLKAWLEWLNKKYGYDVKYEDVDHWALLDFYPGLEFSDIFSVLEDPQFWKTVKPKEDAIFYLKKLIEEDHQDVYICTNSYFRTIAPKVSKVLQKYFPFIDLHHLIVIKNKQMVKCDIMVDDGPQNLENGDYWRVLMDCPHNRSYDAEANGMLRVTDWKEIYSFIQHLDLFYSKNSIKTVDY